MKRQLISLITILPLLILFSSLDVYAQGGDPNLRGTKPPPAPTPKPPSVRGSRPVSNTPVMPTLSVGEERKGRLDPSDKSADGNFVEEMILLNVKSDDWLSFHIESDNPSTSLQIFDRSNGEVAVAKDISGDFKLATPTAGAPADGDYRLRVTCAGAGKNAVPFTIKVNRLGLTSVAYAERYQKIYANYRKEEPASVEETVANLEELGRDNPSRSTAFELLGIIHFEVRKDVGRAEVAMEQALRANGTAVIQVSFDNQWRRLAKLRSGDFGFEEARSGWLKIGPGQMTLTDLSGKTLGMLSGQQIKELTKTLIGPYNMVTITANNIRKPYIFAPKTMQQAETDLVIKLIQTHVVGRAY
jgi:hypothetical protein